MFVRVLATGVQEARKHTPVSIRLHLTDLASVISVFVEVLLQLGHVLWGINALVALEGLVQ